MGKADDMRRSREERFTASLKKPESAARPADVAPPVAVAVKAPVAAEDEATSASAEPSADATEGRCPECGKTKPVANGVMASHQHGLGKACAGSRKPPV